MCILLCKCVSLCIYRFLGAFANFRRATISFVISVCPSVRMEQLGFDWTDFREIWYLTIFRHSVEEVQFWLKSGKNNGHFHENLCTFVIIFRWILLRMRNVSDKICTENQNIHFMFNNIFPKIVLLWDNVEKHGRPRQATDDNIIRRIRFACWITKATDTHSEDVTLIAFPRHQFLRERASLLRYITSSVSLCHNFMSTQLPQ
jgi:hypothetical protein